MKIIVSALLSILASTSALAGSWDWGCVGMLPDKSLIRFSRDTLAIVNTTLPPTFSSTGVINAGVSTFEAVGTGSGFEKEMSFKSAARAGGAKLAEIKSKRISLKEGAIPCGESRGRELTDERTTRVYELTAPMFDKPVKVKMHCFEAITTTCG